MKTRCKFIVTSVEQMEKMHVNADHHPERIRMEARYDYDDLNGEDISFSEATPQGHLEFIVTNPLVLGTFRVNQAVYLDLTPIPDKLKG